MDTSNLGKLIATFVSSRPRLVAAAQSRLGSQALAEDLVQDTWMKIETARPERIDNPGGFIAQVAQNAVIDHFRKERRRAEIDAEVQGLLWEASDEISAERRLMGREVLRAVQAALLELPDKTRRIFLMNRIDGLSHRRIAEITGMTDEAVYYHIRRALDHLARLRDDLQS